jgi:uncharacterized C2H2 Zn-finger protein
MKSETKKTEKEEKGSCVLRCPKCKKAFGKMRFTYGGYVKASNVTITAGKKRKLKDGDVLACSLCDFEMSNWDVMLCIAESGAQDG